MKRTILFPVLFLTAIILGISGCSKENSNTNSIKITSTNPDSPANLPFGEFVLIRYEYHISHPEGARIWVQPYTDGNKTPNFLYSKSKIFTGKGSREVGVSVKDGPHAVLVDQLRIIITTPDQEKSLYESFLDVQYTFTD